MLILNGELADDNKHGKNQLVELHPDGMMRLSIEALKPLTDLLQDGDLLYVTRGTEAHSGPGSWMDNAIGADLGAVESEPGVFSTQNLLVTIDGVRFNVAHHPPMRAGSIALDADAVRDAVGNDCALCGYRVEGTAAAYLRPRALPRTRR